MNRCHKLLADHMSILEKKCKKLKDNLRQRDEMRARMEEALLAKEAVLKTDATRQYLDNAFSTFIWCNMCLVSQCLGVCMYICKAVTGKVLNDVYISPKFLTYRW